MVQLAKLTGNEVPDAIAFDVYDPTTARLESTLRRRLFSVRFQYVVSWLALVYLALSFATFILEITAQHMSSFFFAKDDLPEEILTFLKLGMTLMFLVEIIARMRVTGPRYWLSVWNLTDFIVVVSCMAVELLAVILNDVHFIRYDSLLMCFRVWYALRMIRLIGLLKEAREEESVRTFELRLQMYNDHVQTLRLQSNQMEIDLVQIRRIIHRFESERQRVESDIMLSHSSSWHSIVPHQTALKLKNPILRKAMSSPAIRKKKRLTLPQVYV